MDTSRTASYAELVARRKACRLCPELANPSDIAGGRFDSQQIGPWTRWQGNLGAQLMVVGQDWGDSGYFERHHGWDRESDNPTNRRLRQLLESIGVAVPSADLEPDPQVAFFTNAVLCLKPPAAGFQGSAARSWLENCRSYLRAQIELIRPAVVVGLGGDAYKSALLAFGHRPRELRDAVTDPHGTELLPGTRAFAVYHCGNRTVNMYRSFDLQLGDWQRIGQALTKGDS